MSRLYVIVRNDLDSLNAGKAMAQANHSGTQFLSQFNGKYPNVVKEWLNEGKGFGTVIVLESAIETLDYFKLAIEENKLALYSGIIIDDTYPIKVPKEFLKILSKEALDYLHKEHNLLEDLESGNCSIMQHTCSWFFVEDDKVDEFKKYCDRFGIKLHK